MRCPNDDAEMVKQTRSRDGLDITYAQCPVCHGYWLDSFNANYVKTEDIGRSFETKPSKLTIHPVCPTCQEPLTLYHGENVPANVRAWRCPNGDGYFFPEAELFTFKKAQEAKLQYYKLWNIPIPSVMSVLLVAIAGIISVGLLTTYLQYQNQQTTIIQARDIVRFQQAFVAGSSVSIALTTTVPADATIHIGNFSQALDTQDRLLHTVFLSNLQAGTYQYNFTVVSQGNTIQSDTYFFTIP